MERKNYKISREVFNFDIMQILKKMIMRWYQKNFADVQ